MHLVFLFTCQPHQLLRLTTDCIDFFIAAYESKVREEVAKTPRPKFTEEQKEQVKQKLLLFNT